VAAAGFKVKGEAKADEPRKGDGSGTSEPAPAADVGDPVDPAPDADAKLDPPRRRRPGEGGTGRAPEHQRAAGGVLQGLARTVGAAAGVLADAPNAAAGVGGAAKAALARVDAATGQVAGGLRGAAAGVAGRAGEMGSSVQVHRRNAPRTQSVPGPRVRRAAPAQPRSAACGCAAAACSLPSSQEAALQVMPCGTHRHAIRAVLALSRTSEQAVSSTVPRRQCCVQLCPRSRAARRAARLTSTLPGPDPTFAVQALGAAVGARAGHVDKATTSVAAELRTAAAQACSSRWRA